MGDVVGHDERPILDLSPSATKAAKTISDAMEGFQMFEEQRADITAFLDRIGMVPGHELAIAGSVLGQFISGGLVHGTPVGAWPDALMKLLIAPREQAIRDFTLPSVDPQWVSVVAGIAWEAMVVLSLACERTVPGEGAVSIRTYLEFLCHTIATMAQSMAASDRSE